MRRFLILCILLVTVTNLALCQVQDTTKKFTPSGKVEARIFSDFFYEFNQKKTAFEITRVYLGYNYNYSQTISARVTMDVSKPDIMVNGKSSDTIISSLQNVAHLKFAYGVYQKNKFSLSFGMIELNQFKLQDQFWSRRYVMKTIQDEYGICPSADIGVKADYKILDWLSADITMRNGEGFKKVQADNIYWYGLGFTLQPFKGFTYRTYFDYSKKVIGQINFSNFVSYNSKKFKIGFEVAVSQDNGYSDGKKLIALSTSAGFKLSPKLELFGRLDKLTSNTLTGSTHAWNYDNNLSLVMLGLQFNPIENIAFAVNGRYQVPENTTKDKKVSVYMNVDFKF